MRLPGPSVPLSLLYLLHQFLGTPDQDQAWESALAEPPDALSSELILLPDGDPN